MKCFECKKEIINEMNAIHLGDGDFVCSKECEKKFNQDRDEFFDNARFLEL